MNIAYLEYFGLDEKPFGLTPDSHFYYEAHTHREALDHLKFFLSQREGFACIYGDVGTGKTVLTRVFLDSVNKSLYNTALILNPIMSDNEFMRELLHELKIEHDETSNKAMFTILEHFLVEQYRNGKETIIAIDEAQLLADELLEFIRILSNLETEKEKILHIILFGQEELIGKLKAPNMRYLSQRITVIFRLKPLSLREVNLYITHRLLKAGSKGFLGFTDSAMSMIYAASKGYPRLINIICDRCLLLLYSKSGRTVNSGVVKTVLKEESVATLTDYQKNIRNYPRLFLLAGLTAAIILFVLSYLNIIPVEKLLRNIAH